MPSTVPSRDQLTAFREEIDALLNGQMLPFWLERSPDQRFGGFITHFDEAGRDTGEDEKSLIAQARMLYTFSSALRAGCDPRCGDCARQAADFLIERMWDESHGGFYWMVDRRGRVTVDAKVLYGHSFAIYAFSEYTLATGDPRGGEYAQRVFDLIQKYAADTFHGGYLEMFDRRWRLAGPGGGGGDRKTLDAHMHLMEAFTTLYECTRGEVHRRKLEEVIAILTQRLLHPRYGTGIPQFTLDWQPTEQIKFDIVWGWDRFKPDGQKNDPLDNTSFGHNLELAWLLMHALDLLDIGVSDYRGTILKLVDHAVEHGIDYTYGGVYVEGPHAGGVHDREKEFWQQCEAMIGLLDAYLRFGEDKYLIAYEAVHRFVFTKGINFAVGELWPLLTREGEPIWRHTSHAWKINYHSVRGMIQSRLRIEAILSR